MSCNSKSQDKELHFIRPHNREYHSITPTSTVEIPFGKMNNALDASEDHGIGNVASVFADDEMYHELPQVEVAKERAKRKRQVRNAMVREQLHNLVPDENQKKKFWKARPTNWEVIAQHFKDSKSASATIETFPEVFKDYSASQKSGYLYRWRKDLENGRSDVRPTSRAPSYGSGIDDRLLTAVQIRQKKGIRVDYTSLRELLIPELVKENKTSLLFENDGPYIFGNSWAQRFFKRHKLLHKSEGDIMGNNIDQEEEEVREDQDHDGRGFSRTDLSLQNNNQGNLGNLNQNNRPINNLTISKDNYIENDHEQGSDDQNKKLKVRRIVKPRPLNWDIIAKYFIQSHSISATVRSFPEIFINYSPSQRSTYLYRWKKDYESGKNSVDTKIIKAPIYGNEIDNKLLECVKIKFDNGDFVDYHVLRNLLIGQLEKHDRMDILLNSASKFCFGKSWAQRFFKRHKLQSSFHHMKNEKKDNMKDNKVIYKRSEMYKLPDAAIIEKLKN